MPEFSEIFSDLLKRFKDIETRLKNFETWEPVAGGDTDASYVVMGATAALPNERVLSDGEGTDVVDGGAGSTVVVDLDIPGLVQDTLPDETADFIATWDNSAGSHKKVVLDDVSGVGNVGDDVIVNAAANASTSSLVFVDIAGALSLTITPVSGVVELGFTCYCTIDGGSGFFDFEIDGANFVGDDGLAAIHFASGERESISMTARVTGLTVAAHTFKVQYKLTNVLNTLTVYKGAGTANRDTHPHFWVQEV